MTQVDLGTQATERGPSHTAAEALAAVVDDVGALARAELRLAATEARGWLVRAGLGLALLWLSLSLFQVFALLVAISPLLFASQPMASVIAALLLSLAMAGVVSIFAVRELRRLKDGTRELNQRH